MVCEMTESCSRWRRGRSPLSCVFSIQTVSATANVTTPSRTLLRSAEQCGNRHRVNSGKLHLHRCGACYRPNHSTRQTAQQTCACLGDVCRRARAPMATGAPAQPRSDERTNIKHRTLICKAHSLKNPEFKIFMYIFNAPETLKRGAYNKRMFDVTKRLLSVMICI